MNQNASPAAQDCSTITPAWHAAELTAVEQQLATSSQGLTTADARLRLQQYGPNELEEARGQNPLLLFLLQFRSPLIYILLIALVITLVIGEYVDSIAIGVVLLLNAIIGFVQERQAERSVRALMQLVAPKAHVVRDGHEIELASRELVPGDLVLLETGARVPADLRLIGTNGLEVDESLLTGESVPVGKHTGMLPADTSLAERANLAYAGTIVTRGRGRGYVIATGTSTALGSIAAQIRGEPEPATPLQRRMDRLARLLGIVVAIAAVVAFAVGIARGESPIAMFTAAVALAVSAVPEGLPVAFTITLTVGVRRMAQRNAIVRRITAVETMGSTTTIGTDKTGTLTENRMTVQQIWAGGRRYPVAHSDDPADEPGAADGSLPPGSPLYLTLITGILTSEAEIYETENGLASQGDPTEAALLIAATQFGIDPSRIREEYQSLAFLPFESERRFSATVREHEGQRLLLVKGAPERVLGMCDRQLTDDGLTTLDRDAMAGEVRSMAAQGLRVLAMAYQEIGHSPPTIEEIAEPRGLTFVGLQGMLDPPRPGVRDAIAGCQRAGMRVVMITGDHALTARAIGRDVGVAGVDAPVLTGNDIERMSDEELERTVGEVSVYARVAPEHKLRIVHALRKRGEVVAITGDGVNDAPALKAADIGVAMGRAGTDVAREAADMVLADDNFVSIYAAVEEGRITFDNLRKVTFFLVSTGLAEVMTIVAALLIGLPLPLLAAQILWLNLVTEGIQHIALAIEPGEPDVLKRPPRSPQEGIISRLLWERIILSGIVMAAGTLLLFGWELQRGASMQTAQTVALTTLVLYQAFQLANARSERRSIFQVSPLSNRLLFLAAGASLAVHIGAIYFPPTQFVLRVEPVSLSTWLWMIATAATIVVAVEIHKLIRRNV